QWLPHADDYMAELIRLEGRGDDISHQCGQCCDLLPDGTGLRCEDCHHHGLYCVHCCVEIHSDLPLHHIKRWTKSHFQSETLKSLGLRLQFGHAPGERCPCPVHVESFIVLDMTGIHDVRTWFCGCNAAQAPYVQLLRHSWFPATSKNPRTAATVCLLKQYNILSAMSTVTAAEFYRYLEHLTNKTGLDPPAVSCSYVSSHSVCL
ncbi:hypothetical protein DICSQDRAFT_62834, partial [Dichomitus squalens LYAD-421 SS1]